MSVTIKVDLDASPALNELAELEILLKSLGHDIRDIDMDLGDSLGDITSEIQDLVSALEEAEDRLGRMAYDLNLAATAWEDVDFGIHQFPSVTDEGGGRSGGSIEDIVEQVKRDLAQTDGGGRTNQDLARRFESLFGLSPGSVERTDPVDAAKFRDAVADFHNLVQHGEKFNLKGHSLPGDVQPWRSSGMTHRNRWGGLEPASMARKRALLGADLDFDAEIGGGFGDDDDGGRLEAFGDVFEGLNSHLDGFDDRIKKLVPTMKKWWQLIAVLLPLLIAVGVQVLGVAAAFGAMAAAGGAIIGLGLIGHANDMTSALERAKMEVRDFKADLFEVFSPTAQVFAPIQSEFMDFAPEELSRVATAMQDLVTYSDLLFNMWSALAGGAAEFVNILVRNEAIVEQLTTRFGGLIGTGLLNFFEWLMQSAYRNQNLLVGLGDVLIKIMVVIYNVSMAVSWLALSFQPLFGLLVWISELLRSDMVIGFATIVAWTYVLGKVIGALGVGLVAVGARFLQAVAFMSTYTASTWGAVAATLALATAVGLLTMGASLLIGGAVTGAMMSDMPTGPGGAGGSGPDFGGGAVAQGGGGRYGGAPVVNNYHTYEFTNYGDMSNDGEQRFRSQFERLSGEKTAMTPPDPGVQTESSQTNNSTNTRGSN